MTRFKTKADIVMDLQRKGYDNDFVMRPEELLCVQKMQTVDPNDFEVAASYRFQAKPGEDKDCVIFALRSIRDNLKGILITYQNGFKEIVRKRRSVRSLQNSTL
jgi:hypothetical protein